ncbi:MAG: glycosyltransferase family 9 protein [Vampirovibrionales bacterium]|nr:glycosyltransferase family 9 protein [Vampirovibrionales bacterium]
MTIPLLRAVAAEAGVACDVLCSEAMAAVLKGCPYVENILIEPKGLRARLALLKPYNRVILLRKSVTWAILAQLAGVAERWGYDKQRWPWGYRRWGVGLTQVSTYPHRQEKQPMVSSHLSLLLSEKKTSQIVSKAPSQHDTHLELWPLEQDKASIQTLLKAHGVPTGARLAGVHAVAGSHGKTVPPKTLIPAIRRLHRAGFYIVMSGLSEDWDSNEALAKSAGVAAINLAGKTSIGELIALCGELSFLLSLDSGPLHVASAMNVAAIVGVYGPTNEHQWGVRQPGVWFRAVSNPLDCRPCYAKVCEHNRCKLDLKAEWVEKAVQDGLNVLRSTERM